jgi:uncharacterized protein (DUF1697 family)
MPVYVALLRGINVGGRTKVSMPGLKSAFEDFGATEVQTYIQSGNVVFIHPERSAPKLETGLTKAIADHAGSAIDVMLRTGSQMRSVVEKNPYPHASGTTLHVMFCHTQVDKAALARIEPTRFAPEEATAIGREIYLHLPHGMGRAKLPVALGKLNVPLTARNWNTVTKLKAMAEATST